MLTIESDIPGYRIKYYVGPVTVDAEPVWSVTAYTPSHIKLVTDHIFTDKHQSGIEQCPLCIRERENKRVDHADQETSD